MGLIPQIQTFNIEEVNRALRKLATSKLGPTAIPTFAGAAIGTLTLADGSITDSGGAIDFGDEDLSTSGNLTLSGLTPGRVLFAGTGGLISDDLNLFWDNTNKWLGINTTPDRPLTISQLADDSGIKLSGFDDVSGEYVYIHINAAGYTKIVASSGMLLNSLNDFIINAGNGSFIVQPDLYVQTDGADNLFVVSGIGKITAGSFGSPTDVTNVGPYGFEIHYSGNDYDVTGIRSRAQLVTTDTTATALGGLFQAANNDNINAGVLMGFMAEAIGKSTSNASTITTMRGGLIGTEWGALDIITNLKTLHLRGHSLNAAGAGSFGTGYALYIENEAVGGNGQAYDAGIYFKGTSLSAGNKAFTYGIDFSDATYGTSNMLLSGTAGITTVDGGTIGGSTSWLTVNSSGHTIIRSTDASDLIQIYHNNSDPFIKWNDGFLMLETDEGIDTNTEIWIRGKGTGWGKLKCWDEDNNEYLIFECAGGKAYVSVTGIAPVALTLQAVASAPIEMFRLAPEGKTQELQIYGFGSGSGGRESLDISVEKYAANTAEFYGLDNYVFDGILKSTNGAQLGDGGTTDYTQVEADGTLVFNGDATVWNDIQFPLSGAKVPASNAPTWETFTTNTKEYSFSVGDYIDTQANEAFHGWKLGTTGHVHMHITTKAANSTGSNRFAKFQIWVSYCDTGETWQETNFTAELTIPDGTAALEMFYLDMGDLTLTNYVMEAELKLRVKRIAATGGTEYVENIFITEAGIHIESDTVGSRQETIK